MESLRLKAEVEKHSVLAGCTQFSLSSSVSLSMLKRNKVICQRVDHKRGEDFGHELCSAHLFRAHLSGGSIKLIILASLLQPEHLQTTSRLYRWFLVERGCYYAHWKRSTECHLRTLVAGHLPGGSMAVQPSRASVV